MIGLNLNFYILYIIVVYISNMYFCFSVFRTVKHFYLNTFIVLLYLIVASFAMSLHYMKFHTLGYLCYVLTLLSYIIVHILIKEQFFKKLFVFLTAFLSSLIIFMVPKHIVAIIGYFVKIRNTYYLEEAIILLFFIIHLIVIHNVYKKRIPEIFKFTNNKIWAFLCVFPFFRIIVLIAEDASLTTRKESMTFLVSVFFIIFTYLVLYFGIKSTDKMIEARRKLSLATTTIEKQKEYYTSIKKSLEKMKYLRHDFKHHISVLMTLNNRGEHVELDAYIKSLQDTVAKTSIVEICENKILNAILSTYVMNAMEHNIEVEIRITAPEFMKLDPLELGAVFGNCFNNAIDACKNLSTDVKRYIHVKSNVHHDRYVLVFENSCESKYNDKSEAMKTQKLVGGVGLKSVQSIVENNGGDFSVTCKENVFTICISVKL